MRDTIKWFFGGLSMLLGLFWLGSSVLALMFSMNNKLMSKMECSTYYYYEVLVPIAPIACLLRTPMIGGKK